MHSIKRGIPRPALIIIRFEKKEPSLFCGTRSRIQEFQLQIDTAPKPEYISSHRIRAFSPVDNNSFPCIFIYKRKRDKKMKKIIVSSIVLFSLLAASSAFSWEYGRVNRSGRVFVLDNEGNYSWGQVQRDGSISLWNSQGNHKWGRIDKRGNMNMIDSQGNYYWGSVNSEGGINLQP
jgi:hypothetical protein